MGKKKDRVRMFRQGDVLLVEVGGVPKGSTKLDHTILAFGEVTGHKHVCHGKSVAQYLNERVQYLSVKEATARLQHEEHGPLEVPTGVYKVVIQREYTPEAVRNVVD